MGLCPDSIPHERISWESQALLSMSSLPPNKPAERRMKNAMDRTLDGIYIKLEDIQTLIIRDTSLSFDFRQKVNGIIVPKRFLTNSLKKLYLPLPDTPGESIATKTLSARNAVWLMLYIKNLRTAHLGFAISNVDSDFLSEHSDYFKEMSSVTELSIAFTFIWRGDDKKTWWGLEEEKEWEAGNKKTMAALNFLKVTRSLTYLEIFHRGGSRNPDDKSVLQVSCLKSLTRSFSSLRHLRLLGIGLVNIKDPLGTHYSMFKNLRIFSMHLTALLHLKHLKELELPETLEIIALPLFEVKDEDPVEEHFQELDFLCKVIHDRDLPNLRQVIVPQLPNASDGKYITDRAEKKVWLGFMIQLEQFLGMSRPKVEFKRLGPGDIGESRRVSSLSMYSRLFFCNLVRASLDNVHIFLDSFSAVGDPSKGETGISVHRWLSE